VRDKRAAGPGGPAGMRGLYNGCVAVHVGKGGISVDGPDG
jgi:hypothetical protein